MGVPRRSCERENLSRDGGWRCRNLRPVVRDTQRTIGKRLDGCSAAWRPIPRRECVVSSENDGDLIQVAPYSRVTNIGP
jgi:hypothetical protein